MRAMISVWARAMAASLITREALASMLAVEAARLRWVTARKATARKVMTESINRVMTRAMASCRRLPPPLRALDLRFKIMEWQ